MSWLGRQFAKKSGGTRVGNIIRRLAQNVVDQMSFGLGGAFTDQDGDGRIDLW